MKNENPVVWFEIYTNDLLRARKFYETVLQVDGFAAGNNSTIVYFNSEDCSIEESRIEAAGGRINRTKMSVGEYGFVVLASDTEGNMFGLHSLK